MKPGANLIIGGALFALAVFVGAAGAVARPHRPGDGCQPDERRGAARLEILVRHRRQGRDIYSRVVHGARISLTVGIVSQLINTIIGVSLGLSAGYWGGWWDDFVNGLTNLMLAIPSLIFALAIMAILGPGLDQPADRLGLTNWSFTCRIARASALSLKSQGYVQAAKVLGYGDICASC